MMRHMFAGGWYGGNWDTAPEFMQNMMQQYWGGLRPFIGITGFLDVIREVLIIVLLIAAIRWLWAKGNK